MKKLLTILFVVALGLNLSAQTDYVESWDPDADGDGLIDLPMWLQQGVDINGEEAHGSSGYSVSLSSDGTVVATGARFNDGNGINSGHTRIYAWDGSSWSQLGGDIDGEAAYDKSGYSVSLSSDGTVVAIGANGNDGNGSDSGHTRIYAWDGSSWSQLGGDIDGEAADQSGHSVSLSSDGTVVAIGAVGNDGNGSYSGHTRIYVWDGSSWSQLGSDIEGEAAYDESGYSVSLSSDGTAVAIGANRNDGNGINSGHTRIYTWEGSSWSQLGGDIDGEAADDYSGLSVSLSSDGTVVAIGARFNDGNGSASGHTRIYAWEGSSWSQLGGDIDGEAADDYSGLSVSLSSDGTVVAIGAPFNDGSGSNSGHTRIYVWDGSSWSQLGGDIDGEAADQSGQSVSLSSDGTAVVIGAPYNDGNGSDSGHVRIYALCDAPESSATAAVFGTGSTTSLNLSSFTAPSSGADGYAIYMSDANSFTPPSDGDEPVADASWNGTGQQTIYFGTSSSPDITVTDLAPGTQYYFQIYAYNDCSGTEVYEGTGLNATATTEQGELTIVGLTGDDKEYDSTTDATASGTATLSGIVGAHDVSLSGTPTFTFASADAGTGIAIATTGCTLSGADASKYTLTQPTLSADITMCPSPSGPATAAEFGVRSSNSLHLSGFTAPAGGADGYVIYMNSTDSFTPPNDGEEPAADAIWNDAGQQAVYFYTSSESDLTITGLSPNTSYYFQVYAFTDCAGFEVYETTGLSTGLIETTPIDLPMWLQQGDDIDGEASDDYSGKSVSLSSDGSVVAIGAEANDGNGSNSGHTRIYAWDGSSWSQLGGDIDGEAAYDWSGYSVSLSSDGTVVAIGAPFNAGNGSNSGHVRIYEWDGTSWTQRGLDIAGEAAGDYAGRLSLSSDGSLVAIGAPYNDNNGNNSGHVRVFEWDGSVWILRGAAIQGEVPSERLGDCVALSADGSILAIGAAGDDGHVRIYAWDGASESWNPRGSVIDGWSWGVETSEVVSLSSDGNVVAIGSPWSRAHSGSFSDTDWIWYSGQVHVYEWDGSDWIQRGGAIEGEYGAHIGTDVSLSSDGNILAVGANESDIYSFIGDPKGYTSIYEWDGNSWNQRGGRIVGEAQDDLAGSSVSLSSDGSLVAIGAIANDGNGYSSGHTRIYALCDAPESSATAAVFGTGSTTSLNLSSFTAPSSGADGYAIYMSDANSFTPPSDGDEPVADVSWNGTGQQTIYFGESSSPNVSVTDLELGTNYYFQIYAYNDCAGTEIYEETGLSATATTELGELIITGLTGEDKEYDGTMVGAVSGTAALSGVVGFHDVNLSGSPSFTFASADAGSGIMVNTTGYALSGTDAHKYTLTQPTLSADITTKALTVSGLTGDDKEYDGTALASASGTATLSGVETGDDVILGGSPVFTYASANVGTGVTITTSGYTISGTDSGNYTLTQPTLSGDITAKELVITGITGGDKAYDGTTVASASGTATLSGVETGDDVILGGSPVFTYASANVGTGITINTTGYAMTGTDALNYTLTQPTSSGAITAKELVITGITGADRAYDGTTVASASGTATLSGVETGDDVILGGSPVFTYGSANVGTGITITTSGYTISGTDSGNYTLTQPTLSGAITAKELVITGITGGDRAYDGTTVASASGTATLSGVETGDDVILGGSPVSTYASANVGTGVTITTSGYTISGTDSGNYTLTQPTLSGDITAKELTITGITGDNKVYDGTTAATATGTATLSGIIGADDVYLGGSPVFTYASANVGTGVTITTSGYTISGTDSGNYTLTQPTLSGDITAKELVITGITGGDRAYDGTTVASASGTATLSGVETGDDVILGGSPVFTYASANVGTGVTITTSGYTISGTDSGNYTLTQPTLSGAITAKELVITGITGGDRAYDGTTVASASGTATLSGVETGDDVILGGSPVFTYASANVGTGVTITTSGYTISGTDSGNYTLTQPTLSGDITAKELVITGITGGDKAYDGTTVASASGTATLSGVETGDDVILGGSPVFTYASANVGTGITINTTGYAMTGTDALNYTLTQPTSSGAITAKELVITGITGADRAYDGTTVASASGTATLSGVETGDDVILGGSPVFTYGSANVGTGVTITTSGYTISGTDSGNYTLTQPTLSGAITAKELVITGITGGDRAYDGTTVASASGTATLSGVETGDDVILGGSPVSTYASANVGTGITITTSGYTISGTDSGNYTLTQPTLSGDITAKELVITGITGGDKAYDGTTVASASGTATLSGVETGDDVILGGSPVFTYASANVGTGITINTTGYAMTGTDALNYTLTQPTLSGDITAKELTITGITGDNKVYDGTTAATATGTATLVGVASGDDVSLGGSPVFAFASENVGTGITITVTGYTAAGADIGNYTLTQPSLSASIGVNGEPLTVFDFISLDTNAVNTFSMTTHFDWALDSLSNHPLSPAVIDRNGFLGGHVIEKKVFLEYSIHQVVDSINALNGHE